MWALLVCDVRHVWPMVRLGYEIWYVSLQMWRTNKWQSIGVLLWSFNQI